MLNNEFHFMLLRCFQSSNRLIMKEAKKEGLLSGQPKILEYLWENDGSKPMEIAAGCALDKSTVASLLLRMETMGLIEKKSNQTDKRCLNIFLTRAGKEQAKRIKKICQDVDRFAMRGISKEEKEVFFTIFNKIITNLS